MFLLPIEWISGVGRHDAEERNLTTNQEDEQGDRRPQNLLPELNLPIGFLDLRDQLAERFDEFEEFNAHLAIPIPTLVWMKMISTGFVIVKKRRRGSIHALPDNGQTNATRCTPSTSHCISARERARRSRPAEVAQRRQLYSK